MKFSRIYSAQVSGLSTNLVTVETDVHRGLYLFQIVGLPDKAVEESRERVISALRNALDKNIKAENQKIIVSLSPAELKKEGAYFDVAIALGYLSATEALSFDAEGKIFVGELALNGEVRPIRGLLSIAKWAIAHGFSELYIPAANQEEAALIEGITIYPAHTLEEIVLHLGGTALLSPILFSKREKNNRARGMDFSEIRGQESAKRALVLAAAGGHNVVLYGPPGTGKTMLAKAFHSILPALEPASFLEVATIYSSLGLVEDVLGDSVPLRAPHHSASHVAIIGGGQHLRPGDITLAHRGVLYLDEFPEFDRRVIEALREPLEDGHITVARAKGSVRYPARFILLAAMNPCPCGYRGSGVKPCTCSGNELARYQKKLSGPIIDRIDLWVPVQHIEYESLHEKGSMDESDVLRKKAARTRARQLETLGKQSSELSTRDIQEKEFLTPDAKQLLQDSAEKLRLSPRSYIRTIKVARTIADMAEKDMIEVPDILEALQYRPKMD